MKSFTQIMLRMQTSAVTVIAAQICEGGTNRQTEKRIRIGPVCPRPAVLAARPHLRLAQLRRHQCRLVHHWPVSASLQVLRGVEEWARTCLCVCFAGAYVCVCVKCFRRFTRKQNETLGRNLAGWCLLSHHHAVNAAAEPFPHSHASIPRSWLPFISLLLLPRTTTTPGPWRHFLSHQCQATPLLKAPNPRNRLTC